MATSEEFSGATGSYLIGRSNLADRIVDAWRDMDASTGRLLREQPTEARLLFYVLMSDMIFFLSWSIKAVVTPTAEAAERLPLEVSFWLVFALLCRTSAIYFMSILIGSAARIMGGTGTWRETRTAVFWGALVAAPFGFLCAIITVVLNALEPVIPMLGADWVALPPYWVSLIPFVWFISAGLARAHNFERVSTVFAAMSSIAVAGIVLAMYLRAQGVI